MFGSFIPESSYQASEATPIPTQFDPNRPPPAPPPIHGYHYPSPFFPATHPYTYPPPAFPCAGTYSYTPPTPAYYPFPAAATFHYLPDLVSFPTSGYHPPPPNLTTPFMATSATTPYSAKAVFTSADDSTDLFLDPSLSSTAAFGRPPHDCLQAAIFDHTPKVNSPGAAASNPIDRPKLQQHKEEDSETEEEDNVTSRDDCAPEIDKTGSNYNFVTRQLLGELSKFSTSVYQLAASIGIQTSEALATESAQAATVSVSPFVFTPKSGSTKTAGSASSSFCAAASSSASSGSSPIGASSIVSVAPQVFDERPTPTSGQETRDTAPDYYSGHHNPMQSPCVSNLSEQNLEGRQQQYGFHNLIRHSVFLSDGSEHSYFALPENYPLERSVPEPVFDVYDDDTEGCSSKSVDVFAGTPRQQAHEEDPLENEKLAKSFHKASENAFSEQLLRYIVKALETEQTSAYVLDYTFQQQQQNAEKTSTTVPQLRDQQLNVLVIPKRRKEWDPGATKFLVQFMTATGATELQCTDASKPVMVQILVVQFSASIFEATTMCSYTFEGSGTEMNSLAKHVLVVPFSEITHVAKHALFLICQDTHDQEQVTEVNVSAQIFIVVPCSTARLMVMMLLIGHEFLDGQLAYMSLHTRISSAVWVRYPIIVLSGWTPSFDNRTNIQWDPGIASYRFRWLVSDRNRCKTGQTFTWLQNPLLNDLQCQLPVCNFSYVWDPGIELLFAHQQSINENVKTKCLLLSSKEYLRIWEMGTFFTTFLPP